MGLTRVRAEQISNIDYKQAVRVITLTNINLTGGAPNQVDGVTLSPKDRVLVAGQSTASQNGLYDVVALGTGSTGTWTRTSDANANGEIEAGMIVMVTEGLTYADTSWKLTTNNPITIGSTSLVFAQNTGDSFGIINANGTAVVANSVTSTVSFNSGNNLSITGNATADTITFAVADSPTFTGNVTGNYFLGNGSQLTGIATGTPNSIANGNSNVVVANNGNVTVTVDGSGPVGKFSTGEFTVFGIYSNPNTIDDNVVIQANTNSMMVGPVAVNPANNIFIPDGSAMKFL